MVTTSFKRDGGGIYTKPGEPNSAMQSSHKQSPLSMKNEYSHKNRNIKYISKGHSNPVQMHSKQKSNLATNLFGRFKNK